MKIRRNRNLKGFARDLRNTATLSEILLWDCLKNKKFFGCLFNRQAIIGDYIVDFFCRQERAIVEIDGETHDGKGEYDKVRDNYLKGQGFTVIHIHDYEVKTNIEGVLAYIRKNMLTRTSTEVVSRY